MENSYFEGDVVVCERLSYGASSPDYAVIPLTDIKITLPNISVPPFSKPQIGDVVVFGFSDNGINRYFVKRVAATEGYLVKIRDGKLYLEDVYADSIFIADGAKIIDGASESNSGYFEDPNNLSAVVPEGYVFVLGDNRPKSFDSRSFGFVPKSSIKGRVVFSF